MVASKPFNTKHWLALLVTLFFIVLIAHLAIITSANGQFNIKKSDKTNSFATRMIELPTLSPVAEKITEVVAPSKSVKPTAKPITAETARVLPPNSAEAAANPVTASLGTPSQASETSTEQIPEQAPASIDTVLSAANTPLPTTPSSLEPAQPPSVPTINEAALPAPAFTVQNSGQHSYKVIFTKNGNSNQGKATVRWQQDGEKYTLGMSASMLFIEIFAWESSGLLSSTGMLPERFSDKRYRKSEVAAHFDRAQNKITFSANTPDAVLLFGAQDRISIIWQIAGILSADPKRYLPGNTISLQTVSANDAETWLFTVNEPETLNLENGAQVAQRLTRNPRREFDQKIELWFVPAMNYLPARFQFTETNGDYVDVVWQRVDDLPNTVSR